MQIGQLFFQRLRVEWQRIEVHLHPLTQMLRGLPAGRLALRGEAELLQYFGIDVDVDGFGITRQRMALGPFQVTLVPVAHVLVGLGQFVLEYAVVLLVHLPLPGIGFALHVFLTTLATPAGQEADAGTGRCFVIDYKIRVVAELAAAICIGKSRQLET